MSGSAQPKSQRGRFTTAAALRVLATLVAVLVTLSSLSQTAHFLLVPHALCAEHGELLELGEGSAHLSASVSAPAKTDGAAHADAAPSTDEHEHCQVLARGQREQAQAAPQRLLVVPGTPTAASRILVSEHVVDRSQSALSLAPKTSPPPASRG